MPEDDFGQPYVSKPRSVHAVPLRHKSSFSAAAAAAGDGGAERRASRIAAVRGRSIADRGQCAGCGCDVRARVRTCWVKRHW